MSFSEVVARGSGSIAARLVIEAFPYEFVTHASMATSSRIHGMLLDGVRISHAIDVVSGKLSAQGMTIEFVDTNADRLVSKYLGRGPSIRTFARTSLTMSGTSVNVLSTSGMTAPGTIYMGTEAIGYSTVTSDGLGPKLTGLTRGIHTSVPQAHYVSDGANLAFPVVTDWPLTLEGRRVYLYLYNAKNKASLSGNGELVFRGVISEDAHYDGIKWSLGVDSIVSLLKQQCTGGAGDEVGIRGIHHPREWACRIANRNPDAELLATYAGFWESLAEWCATTESILSSKLAALVGWASGATVKVQPEGASTFSILYFTGTSGTPYPWAPYPAGQAGVPDWAEMISPQDPYVWLDVATGFGKRFDGLDISKTYVRMFSSVVPRAYHATRPYFDPVDYDGTEAAWPYQSFYLDGSTPPQVGHTYSAKVGSAVINARVQSIDVTKSRADLTSGVTYESPPPERGGFAVMLNGGTKIRVGWIATLGNFGNLIEYIQTSGPALCNIGKTPLLKSPGAVSPEDVGVSSGGVLAGCIYAPLVQDRSFQFANELSLEEIVTPELLVAGMHWSVAVDGSLGVRRFQLPVIGSSGAYQLNSSNIIGDVSYERQALGTLSQVRMLSGYDPVEDEYNGVPRTVRDVQASSWNKQGRTLEIKRKSTRILAIGDASDSLSNDEAVKVASFWLGAFGREYWVARVRVPLSLFNIRVGDMIALTSKQFPNVLGGFGVTQKPGVVTGIDWNLAEGVGTITAIMHDREVRGYAPAFRVTSQVNISGNTWDIVVNRTEVTDAALSELLPVGSLVRVKQRGTTSIVTVNGSVVSVVDGTNTVRVAFASTWTPSTSLWMLQAQPSDAHPLNHPFLSYTYQADATARVALSTGTRAAAEFAP